MANIAFWGIPWEAYMEKRKAYAYYEERSGTRASRWRWANGLTPICMVNWSFSGAERLRLRWDRRGIS